MTLSERIKIERTKKGWSQAALGEQLNVSQQAVGKWEKAIAEPDTSAIKTMAELFGVSTDYLIGNDGKRNESTSSNHGDDDFETATLLIAKDMQNLSPTDFEFIKGLINRCLNNNNSNN